MDRKEIIEKMKSDGDLSVDMKDSSISEESKDVAYYQEACGWLIQQGKKEYASLEEFEEEGQKNYELGTLTGYEHSSEYLLNKSGVLFREGQDEQAQLFRDLSKHFKKEHDKLRVDYDRKYHKQT